MATITLERREFKTSESNIPIPNNCEALLWTATAGGGSGEGERASLNGAGGAAGCGCIRARIPTDGATTYTITIGAGGASAQSAGGLRVAGNDGGDTSLTIGSRVYTLYGGKGGGTLINQGGGGGSAIAKGVGIAGGIAGNNGRFDSPAGGTGGSSGIPTGDAAVKGYIVTGAGGGCSYTGRPQNEQKGGNSPYFSGGPGFNDCGGGGASIFADGQPSAFNSGVDAVTVLNAYGAGGGGAGNVKVSGAGGAGYGIVEYDIRHLL